MARPLKIIDLKQLEKLMQYAPTLHDTAEWFSVSEDTIERRIKDKYNCSFAEFRHKKMANVRIRLSQIAIKMALSGDRTMLIFCLKSIGGWQEKPAGEHITSVEFVDS